MVGKHDQPRVSQSQTMYFGAGLPLLTRMLLRTQRMMRPETYLREHVLAEPDGRLLSLGGRRERLAD